ncbi:MAG: hypothetical protein QM530_09965 [Phycisphaerales bacterium]|nr:hypothetical protein [Phycisphaerales bacterium]
MVLKLNHCEDYPLFPQNIGACLSIDDLSLSKGELYTFVTNKQAKGKQGTLEPYSFCGVSLKIICKVLNYFVPLLAIITAKIMPQ